MDDHDSLPTYQLHTNPEALEQQLARAVVRVQTTDVLPLDSEVALALSVPEGAPLLLTGRVAEIEIDQSDGESRPAGMEVRLLNLPAAVRLQLAQWMIAVNGDRSPPDAGDTTRTLDDVKAEINELGRKLDTLAAEDRSARSVVERLDEERLALQESMDLADPELVQLFNRRRSLEQALHEQLEGQQARRETLAAEVAAAERAAAEAEKNIGDIQATFDAERRQAEAAIATAEQLRDEQQAVVEQARGEVDRLLKEERERGDRLSAELTAVEAELVRLRDGELEEAPALARRLEREEEALAGERQYGAVLERRLSDARQSYEKLRAKRRDQKRLLAMMAANSQVEGESLDLAKDLDRIDELLSGLGGEPAADPGGSAEEAAEVEDAASLASLEDPDSELIDAPVPTTGQEDDGWWPLPGSDTIETVASGVLSAPQKSKPPVAAMVTLAGLVLVIVFLVLELVVDGGLILGPLIWGEQQDSRVEMEAPQPRHPVESKTAANPSR